MNGLIFLLKRQGNVIGAAILILLVLLGLAIYLLRIKPILQMAENFKNFQDQTLISVDLERYQKIKDRIEKDRRSKPPLNYRPTLFKKIEN